MLCRTFFRVRPRVPKSVFCVAFNSTAATPVQQSQASWRPFGFPSPEQAKFEYDAAQIAMTKKRKLDYERLVKKRKVYEVPHLHDREGTNEEILHFEIEGLLKAAKQESAEDSNSIGNTSVAQIKPAAEHHPNQPPLKLDEEVELDVVQLSSIGDGLAYTESKDHVVVIPFAVPGDRVLAKVYKWVGNYSHADFVKVVKPSKMREGITPGCKYFSDCGGCQLQMMPYEEQLAHKKSIVERAFRNFSELSPNKIPTVLDTMGSPLQYKYRTKLTPHFSGGGRPSSGFTSMPPVGFNRKNRRQVLDIEQCPIGTEILQEGLKVARAKVAAEWTTYKRGKTILLRETTQRDPETSPISEFDTVSEPVSTSLGQKPDGQPELTLSFPNYKDVKTCTSVEDSMSVEYIGPHKFINRAGSFFQNNNSVLGPFTKYVYDNCMLPSTPSSSDSTSTEPSQPIKYLLDAYCGSGLFTITLSKLFVSALGIDIDAQGIEMARLNAEINQIPNAGFIAADATNLFADVPFPPDQSLVIIDPPRKGASKDFLEQLCKFRAKRIVYVSCNVHTQARDVGMIVQGFGEGCRYEIESLRGFDFFPQTGHVEGVCVLNRVEED